MRTARHTKPASEGFRADARLRNDRTRPTPLSRSLHGSAPVLVLGTFALLVASGMSLPALVLVAALGLFAALSISAPRLVLVVLAVLVIAPLPPALGEATVVRVTQGILLLAIVVRCRPGATASIGTLPLVFAAALAVGAIRGLLAGHGLGPVWDDLRPPVTLFLAFLLGVLMDRDDRRLVAFIVAPALWYSAIASLVTSALGLRLISGRVSSVSDGGGRVFDAARIQSSFTHVALFLLCSSLCFIFLLPRVEQVNAAGVAALVVPSGVVVFLSFSRNSLLALGFSLGLALLLSTRRRRLALLAVTLLLATVVLPPALATLGPPGRYVARQAEAYSARVLRQTSSTSRDRDPSVQFRRFENRWAFQSFSESPLLGHGFGKAYRPPAPNEPFVGEHGLRYVHNLYLWYLVKLGLVGVVVLAAWGLRPVFLALRNTRVAPTRHSAVSASMACAMVGVLVVCFVAPILNSAPAVIFFGAVVGILHKDSKRRGVEATPSSASLT